MKNLHSCEYRNNWKAGAVGEQLALDVREIVSTNKQNNDIEAVIDVQCS